MIYLIGGAPKVGKTIFAKRLRQWRPIVSISTDAIRALLHNMTKPELRPTLFPCCLPLQDIGKQFEQSADDWVNNQLKEAETLNPALIGLITYHIRIDEDLLIEGVHITPSLLQELLTTNPPSKFKAVFILATDESKVFNELLLETQSFNWVRALDPDVLKRLTECIVAYSNFLERRASHMTVSFLRRSEDFLADTASVSAFMID